MYASKNRKDFFWNKKEQHSNHCYVIWEKATFPEQFFLGGRLFLKFDSTLNELDPNFYLVSIGLRQIQSVFLPKSSNLQNKVFTEIQSIFLSTDTHFYFSFHDLWGGYFRLGGYFPF